jgi:hypothetical protein
VIYDSGADIHVFNDWDRFETYEEFAPGKEVPFLAGDSVLYAEGVGIARVLVTKPSGQKVMIRVNEVTI